MASARNGRLGHSRRHFFSETIHRWSLLAQHPSLTTFREAVALVYFLYCAYHAALTLAALRHLLWHRPVDDVCADAASGVACLQAYAWLTLAAVLGLVGRAAQWAPVVVLMIFFGEEALARWRARA